MKQPKDVLLGFKVGTGDAVNIPLRNTAVTGQTQESGKTTTLEALIARSGVPALAFVTKRGERSFAGGHRVQPYFRDRADWQFVDQILEAQLREKNKFLRPWIIRICRNTRTLADVHREVRNALKTAKGMNEGVYTQLDAYLDLIVPEIGRQPLAASLKLSPGLNVMDVSDYATPMQMLFVQSALDWVNAEAESTITIIPEAWEFIPEGKGSPVKHSAISLVRKGSGIGNRIYVDSQDLAGVDKTIVRGCPVFLFGVQREANEIKRSLANVPAGVAKPKPADIARLGLGEFYACWGDAVHKVYVCPAWMEPEKAREIAMGKRAVDSVAAPARRVVPPRPVEPPRKESDDMSEMAELKKMMAQLLQQRGAAPVATSPPTPSAAVPAAPAMGGDAESMYQAFKSRLLREMPQIATGMTMTVTPPEKLRKDFQRAEADRIVATARELSPLAKRVLKLLEALDVFVFQKTIAERLGRATKGGSIVDLGKAVKELAELQFVVVDGKRGVGKGLREKIVTDLSLYQPAETDVEDVYQTVLHHIATEDDAD